MAQTSVYLREMVKHALLKNSSAVVLVHNHPSRLAAPSLVYEVLTRSLQSALLLVDVRVLDHPIVAGRTVLSFVERGLL